MKSGYCRTCLDWYLYLSLYPTSRLATKGVVNKRGLAL